MPDVFKVNGTTIVMATHWAGLDRCVPIIKGGIPELHLTRILGTLKPPSSAALPDPWSAQPVTLAVGSGPTLIFAGDITGYVDRYMPGVAGFASIGPWGSGIEPITSPIPMRSL